MKFYLANDAPFTFSYDYRNQDGKGKYGRFAMRYHAREGDLDEFDKRISSVLKGMVDHYHCPKNKSSPEMSIFLLTNEPASTCQGKIIVAHGKEGFLKDISPLFGQDNVHVKVILSLAPNQRSSEITDTDNLNDNFLSTEAMAVEIEDRVVSCKDSKVQFPNSELPQRLVNSDISIEARLTVEVTFNSRSIRPGANANTESIYEKMLREEIHSDISITAENGSLIKCHKSVLSACSPVFMAMFTTDMEESKTCNVDMPEMSEQAVKSFLNYIYCMNDDESSKNCEIAVELLNAAHKYNVTPDLETAMTNLILSRPLEWFNVDAGVKIFLSARILPNNGDALKEKAIKILKKNIDSLPNSKAFFKMFQEIPVAAMELCLAFASLSGK